MTSSAIPIRPVAAGAALLTGLVSAVSIVALVRWVWAWGRVAAATWGAARRGEVDDPSWPELTSLARWLEAGTAALAGLGLVVALALAARRRSRRGALVTAVLVHAPAVGVVGLAAATSGRDLLVATGSRTTMVVVAVDAVAVCFAAAAATWETWVRRREVGDRA